MTGAAISIWGVRDLFRASASSDWPMVRGVVYRYAVEGVGHLGNRVRFGKISTSAPDAAQQALPQ